MSNHTGLLSVSWTCHVYFCLDRFPYYVASMYHSSLFICHSFVLLKGSLLDSPLCTLLILSYHLFSCDIKLMHMFSLSPQLLCKLPECGYHVIVYLLLYLPRAKFNAWHIIRCSTNISWRNKWIFCINIELEKYFYFWKWRIIWKYFELQLSTLPEIEYQWW